MVPKSFIALVEKMRDLQKRFFNGEKHLWRDAQKLERQVDKAIREIQSGQQSLFKED